MHIIIVGGGKIGSTLAEELSEGKHDVVVIESDEEKAQALAQELNAQVIHGSALEKSILEESGVAKADVLVATTEKEEINLLVTLLAKELGIKRVIARVGEEEYAKLFKKMGINQIISPEHSVADQLNAIITQPDIYELTILHQDVDLFEFELVAKSKLIGKEYHESLTPKDSLIIAMRRKGTFFIPDSHTVFQAGDKVIVIAKKEVIDEVRKIFRE